MPNSVPAGRLSMHFATASPITSGRSTQNTIRRLEVLMPNQSTGPSSFAIFLFAPSTSMQRWRWYAFLPAAPACRAASAFSFAGPDSARYAAAVFAIACSWTIRRRRFRFVTRFQRNSQSRKGLLSLAGMFSATAPFFFLR